MKSITVSVVTIMNLANATGVKGGNDMNRTEFVDYVRENFSVSVDFLRLLDNALHYAELQGWDEDEVYDYLDFMLDCNIGLTQQEIKQIVL